MEMEEFVGGILQNYLILLGIVLFYSFLSPLPSPFSFPFFPSLPISNTYSKWIILKEGYNQKKTKTKKKEEKEKYLLFCKINLFSLFFFF